MNKIYYFSGTGNTLASAKQIAAALPDAQIIPIAGALRERPLIIAGDTVIIMFPTYGYSTPAMVRKFLKKARFNCGYLAVLATYATSAGVSLASAKRLLRRKRRPDYFGKIRCVENYIPIFGFPNEADILRLVAEQRDETAREAAAISAKTKNTARRFNPAMSLINALFRFGRRLFVKRYKTLPECVGCSVCERLCPASCVKVKDGKAAFGKGCEHCQGCLNFCPVKAIRYRNLTPDSARYTHPEIKAEELNR